jgi:hypothetical protein
MTKDFALMMAAKETGGAPVVSLAAILGRTHSAVSQWGDGMLPVSVLWRILEVRPKWFAAYKRWQKRAKA